MDFIPLDERDPDETLEGLEVRYIRPPGPGPDIPVVTVAGSPELPGEVEANPLSAEEAEELLDRGLEPVREIAEDVTGRVPSDAPSDLFERD